MTNKEKMAEMTAEELTEFIKEKFANAEENGTVETIQKFLEWQNEEYKVCKPRMYEEYWCINACGEVCSESWEGALFDISAYKFGNCFKTKEEAEAEARRRMIETRLKRFAEEHNEPIDWGDADTKKCYFAYSYETDLIIILLSYCNRHQDIYFSNLETARQALEEIGEDDIKFWLGVEEK